jgi:hypothetical protein
MPLATLLENVGGLYAPIVSGAEICLPSLAEIGYSGAGGLDIAQLLRCLHHYQPHSVILLPQLLRALVLAAESGAPHCLHRCASSLSVARVWVLASSSAPWRLACRCLKATA